MVDSMAGEDGGLGGVVTFSLLAAIGQVEVVNLIRAASSRQWLSEITVTLQ